LRVTKLERTIGIEVYATHSPGIGGVIRQEAEDFAVEEVLVDGSKAGIAGSKDSVEHAPLGASQVKNRYLLCILTKRNWDMFIALRNIAAQLGISTSQIHTAGIKDAKAVTAQHITIEGVSAEDARKIHVKDVQVRPLGYLRNKLSSYYLLGNSFQVTIRGISNSESAIQKRISKVIEELGTLGGIPNFFGHQRFGTTRPITHVVGKAIIKGDSEKAAMLFLAKPSPYEHPASRQARQGLQSSRDFCKALKDFPKQLRYERSMLEHLAKKPNDFSGTFKKLPIKLRQLFIQAYQSYLFNKSLSRRIQDGLSLDGAEIGDYVINVDHNGLPLPATGKTASSAALSKINDSIKTGKMRLAIPLIGFGQHPSQGIQGKIEKQIIQAEDVSEKNFRIPGMPEMSIRGELRIVMTPIRDFSIDEISKQQDDPRKCLARIGFTLNRSSYATILLRELMKARNPIKAGF
jgi:tRNA pseudouridine13 synthase